MIDGGAGGTMNLRGIVVVIELRHAVDHLRCCSREERLVRMIINTIIVVVVAVGVDG